MFPTAPLRFRALLGVSLCVATWAAPPKDRASPPRNPPTTFEAAVDQLVRNLKKEDADYLKSYPRCDLISFHMGWGMGIRNQLGLWRGNDSLLDACARRAGREAIHPDDASFLLIRGVWNKLHEDLATTDFDTVAPADYFREIDRTLRLAKSTGNVGYLASLPGWMYQVSRLSLLEGTDSARFARLMEEARKKARQDDSLSPLAILYLTFQGGNGIEGILDSQLSSKSPPVEIPSYADEGALEENHLLQPDSLLPVPPRTTVYFWRTLPRREFAAQCLGSLHGKRFRNADDYEDWSRQRRTNPFLRWAWKENVAEADFRELSSDPRRLLEILLLTKRFFRMDMDEFPLVPRDDEATEAFVRSMGMSDSVFQGSPYDPHLPEPDFRPDSATRLRRLRVEHAMAAVANRLDTGDLLGMLGREASESYERTSRTEDLLPYRVLGHVLLATQTGRIVRHPDKKRTFDLCHRYWKEEFLTFPAQDFAAELLFRIDPVRARDRFAEEFRSTPREGSFVRTGILQAMIRQDFAANRAFLRRWFWKTYGKYTDYHPNDTRIILQTLASEQGTPQELLRELTADARYRRHPPKED
ncbi:MAG TPA: hypothetical protein PKO15_09750 [Fibrobacteria bacterium]|nr:hypothetical protein [Fibrobacteria bacterium]HOX51858.1 hypothetical protein [Fibrobacteria bacterium]